VMRNEFLKPRPTHNWIFKSSRDPPKPLHDPHLGRDPPFGNPCYRICPLNVSLNHLVYVQMNTKCRTKCLIECKEIHFENYNKFSRILDKNSTTKRIDIIPIKSAHIEYFEELRIDFDQLLCTCGGIVGLWFRLSPNQISNLILIILHYFK
jgi:hypothetical protein